MRRDAKESVSTCANRVKTLAVELIEKLSKKTDGGSAHRYILRMVSKKTFRLSCALEITTGWSHDSIMGALEVEIMAQVEILV